MLRTIWGPAPLRLVVQGALKVVVVTDPGRTLPLVWIAASAAIPWLVFILPRGKA